MRLENFIYNEERRIVFAYIPKVACTNWKCIFRHLNGDSDYLDCSLAHDPDHSGLVFLNKRNDATAILSDPSIMKFTCVRDPYSRLLSAYLNKIHQFTLEDPNAYRDKWYVQVFEALEDFRNREMSDKAAVDFEVFVNWIHRSNHKRANDSHWMPQTEILDLDNVSYTFMARLENLGQDARWILDRIGCDISFPTQQEISFPATNSRSRLADYYTEDLRKKVARIYEQDFRRLDYPQ